MAAYFGGLFDPAQRSSFFGPQAVPEGAASDDDSSDRWSAHRPFFSWDPSHVPVGALGTWPGSLAPTGTQSVRTGAVTPAVADFGPLGGAGEQANRPYWKDIPGHPFTDPRMPFFVLPPSAIFNMPIITQLPGTPYVGEDGLPHLDGWNPYEGRVVSPGRAI